MQRPSGPTPLRGFAPLLASLALVCALAGPADATVFGLTATNVVIDLPAPLFTSDMITGALVLADTVAPGASFGAADVTALSLDFAGIMGTLADVQADIAPGPVQIFGTRSADGKSLSVLDFRFGFQPSVSGCSFVCAGQIIINSGSDPSNFITLDDLAGNTLSVISSFTPQFTLLSPVPEPAGWMMMIGGLGLAGLGLRRRRSQAMAAVCA